MVDDPLAQLNVVGQKVLAVPTDILNVGSRRVTEDVGILSAKIQDITATLTPPGGLALPNLPALPGIGAASAGAPAAAPAPRSASEATGKTRSTKKMSYLKV